MGILLVFNFWQKTLNFSFSTLFFFKIPIWLVSAPLFLFAVEMAIFWVIGSVSLLMRHRRSCCKVGAAGKWISRQQVQSLQKKVNRPTKKRNEVKKLRKSLKAKLNKVCDAIGSKLYGLIRWNANCISHLLWSFHSSYGHMAWPFFWTRPSEMKLLIIPKKVFIKFWKKN